MGSEVKTVLRRNDPRRLTKPLPRRNADALSIDPDAIPSGAPVLLDTTVYIDQLKGHLPPEIDLLVARCTIFHAAVARAELVYSIGALNPADPRTPAQRTLLEETLDRMLPFRCLSPSDRDWLEAALLTGILARTQSLDDAQRRALLNDALLLMTARGIGAVTISRNTRDMDWLTALRPDAKVLLYSR